jgi:hypothetical protein
MGVKPEFNVLEAKVKLAMRSEQAKSASQFSAVTLVNSGVQSDIARL